MLEVFGILALAYIVGTARHQQHVASGVRRGRNVVYPYGHGVFIK